MCDRVIEYEDKDEDAAAGLTRQSVKATANSQPYLPTQTIFEKL